MLTAECQAEGRNLDTDITLIHEFKPKMPNERFLWNALKQAERRNKILQEERNSKNDHGTRKGHNDACVTNTQTDTITYSKTQTDKQENQSNKKIPKKSMIQQTPLQSNAYIRKRLRSLGESTSDRDLNDAKVILKQYLKTNYIQSIKNKRGYLVDRSKWQKEKSEKPRNDNAAQTLKKNEHQLRKTVPTTNSFEELEEVFENNNIRVEKTAEPIFVIFVDKVNNFSSLSSLLKQIATDEYDK